MNDFSALLVFASSTAIALSALLIREIRYRQMHSQLLEMRSGWEELLDRARRAEAESERLQMECTRRSRWKGRAKQLELELNSARRSAEYVSGKRYENLERYMATHLQGNDHEVEFLGTMECLGICTVKRTLERMVQSAEFEVVIVSPWIKRCAWNEMRAPVHDFILRGGKLTVFTRGDESDFAGGLADDIYDDVVSLGGEVVIVPQLHAKIYMADQKEAIVASANLTHGGMVSNCEAGIWSNDPVLVREICSFVYSLYRLRVERRRIGFRPNDQALHPAN